MKLNYLPLTPTFNLKRRWLLAGGPQEASAIAQEPSTYQTEQSWVLGRKKVHFPSLVPDAVAGTKTSSGKQPIVADCSSSATRCRDVEPLTTMLPGQVRVPSSM